MEVAGPIVRIPEQGRKNLCLYCYNMGYRVEIVLDKMVSEIELDYYVPRLPQGVILHRAYHLVNVRYVVPEEEQNLAQILQNTQPWKTLLLLCNHCDTQLGWLMTDRFSGVGAGEVGNYLRDYLLFGMRMA